VPPISPSACGAPALDIVLHGIRRTSRGGNPGHADAAAPAPAIAGVCSTTSAPVIDMAGLMPSKALATAGAEERRRWRREVAPLFAPQLPELAARLNWLFSQARLQRQMQLLPTYDRETMPTLLDVDLERPIQSLWAEFDALPTCR